MPPPVRICGERSAAADGVHGCPGQQALLSSFCGIWWAVYCPLQPSHASLIVVGHIETKKVASESSLWVKALLSARLCAACLSTNRCLCLTSLLHVQLCPILHATAFMLTCVAGIRVNPDNEMAEPLGDGEGESASFEAET